MPRYPQQKSEKVTLEHVIAVGCLGFLLFLGNYWLLDLDRESLAPYVAYTVTLGLGYLCLMLAGILAGRLWSVRLLDDPFNRTNESFPQETRCIYNEHSINLPTRFFYKKKWNDG